VSLDFSTVAALSSELMEALRYNAEAGSEHEASTCQYKKSPVTLLVTAILVLQSII
jgi:hypothetical protein